MFRISKTNILVWSIFTPLAQQFKAANLGQGFMEYEIFCIILEKLYSLV